MAASNVTLGLVAAEFGNICVNFALFGLPPNKEALMMFLRFFDCVSPGDCGMVIVFLKSITYFMKGFCDYHRILACHVILERITSMMEQNPSQDVQVVLEKFRTLHVLIKQKLPYHHIVKVGNRAE